MLDMLDMILELLEHRRHWDPLNWNSLYIDYHKPYVERAYYQQGKFRVMVHRIHPCTREETLYHPHPWPSAMLVLKGRYELAIGYGGTGRDHRPNPKAALIQAGPGMRYEMTERDAWHYVRPIDGPVLTLMVTGKPFEGMDLAYQQHVARKVTSPLVPLSGQVKEDLLGEARDCILGSS